MWARLRRLLLFCIIYLQSPLAYEPATATKSRQPLSPMQVVARFTRDSARAEVDAADDHAEEGARNATIAEMIITAAVMPAVLVRTPIKAWVHTTNATKLFHQLLHDALDLSSQRMGWWESIESRSLLVKASFACAISTLMQLFGRRGYALVFYGAACFGGLVVFGLVIALNRLQPTPQFVAAVALTVIEVWYSQNVIAVSAAEAAAMKKAGEARVKGTTSTKED